jgi:hypothetical protein
MASPLFGAACAERSSVSFIDAAKGTNPSRSTSLTGNHQWKPNGQVRLAGEPPVN